MKAATTQRIAELLKEVAGAMRTFLKDTATAGNSHDLRTIAGWIAEVEELTTRVHPADVASASGRTAAVADAVPPVRQRAIGKQSVKREARFKREGDALVKIAWSKKNHAEYEHKASRAALTCVVGRVEREGRGRKMFRMEDVLPVVMPDGAEIPSYQAYLCVGWLKTEGLLEQHGRQGYTIPQNVSINRDIERAWKDLPVRGD